MTKSKTIEKKIKKVEVFEEWRKDWATPDVFVKKDQRKKLSPDNKFMLREHTVGMFPFVKFYEIPKE